LFFGAKTKMAKDNLLETLSGRATRNKPSEYPIKNIPLPDIMPTRCNPFRQDLKTLEQGRPDEG
jgi:hypothetical protein